MNILGLFVVVPVLMILFLFLCKDIKSIRAVMVTGATALLALTAVLVVTFLRERAANPDAEMLLVQSWTWYAPLNITMTLGKLNSKRSREQLFGRTEQNKVVVFDKGNHRIYRRIFVVEYGYGKRVFPLVLPAYNRRIRLFHHHRFVLYVYVLRSRPHTDVSTYRSVGNWQKRVFGNEADPYAYGWFGILDDRYHRHILHFGSNYIQYSGYSQQRAYSYRTSTMDISRNVLRFRCARCSVSVPHLESRRSRFGTYFGVYVARRRTDEARRIRLFPRSYISYARSCSRAGLDIPHTYGYIGGVRSI